MIRHYEVVYIFDSALEEAQVNERLARFHTLLASPEKPEPVTAVNHWGKRSLAYPVMVNRTSRSRACLAASSASSAWPTTSWPSSCACRRWRSSTTGGASTST